jgi:hypothetical protein
MTYAVNSRPSLSIHPITAIRLPSRDISETLVAARIDPGVQEAESGFVGEEASVV